MPGARCEHGDADRDPRGCRICARARALRYAQSARGKKKAADWFQANYDHIGRPAKTHCVNGHEYTPENTLFSDGHRRCAKCRHSQISRYFHDKRSNGGSHTEEQWLAICAQANGQCVHCGQVRKLTRDHIIPVSKGGSNDITNIQPLCKPCNSSKRDKIINDLIAS